MIGITYNNPVGITNDTTININNNPNLKSCVFKHTWTGQKFTVQLPWNFPLSELNSRIEQLVRDNFGITEPYEIVEAGLEYQELAEPLTFTPIEKINKYKHGAFYIRPIGVPIPESFLARREASRVARLNNERDRQLNILISSLASQGISHTQHQLRLPEPVTMSGLECSVCYQSYSLNNFTPWTSCEHWKQCCTICMDRWALHCNQVNRDGITSCPMCRERIKFYL